jgi:hypothetical protein
MMLAVTGQDLFIIGGMLATAALGIFGAWRCELIFAKVGALASTLAVCLGLAYFGWKPLFGGSHPSETYFGATMLFVGFLGFAILGAVEESYRRITGTADVARDFPVVPPRRSEGPA